MYILCFIEKVKFSRIEMLRLFVDPKFPTAILKFLVKRHFKSVNLLLRFESFPHR